MQIPDRTTAPPKKEIKNILLPTIKTVHLDNGVPTHIVNLGTQEVVKLEIVFNAGRPFEQKRLTSRAVGKLIKEGTTSKTSAEIAEEIDFYGATMNVAVNLDTANIVLYSLKKHYDKLLILVADILNNPVFPSEELVTFKEKSKHQLSIDLSKNEVVAYRKITEYIFGKDHPYGYNSTPELYEALTRTDVLNHFQTTFTADNCQIFLSGKVDDPIISLTNKHLGALRSSKSSKPNTFHPNEEPVQTIAIPSNNKIQSAIRIGRNLFSRKHKDYNGLNFLITVFGGYFGSRLMSNIREDKGYTYHIFSSIDSLRYGGFLNIGTEVGQDFTNATIDEIFKEMKTLREIPIPQEELSMVRNYLLGQLLNALDGPFNTADIIKTLYNDQLSINDFYKTVETIRTITSTDLQRLANQYLKEEDMWQVIVS